MASRLFAPAQVARALSLLILLVAAGCAAPPEPAPAPREEPAAPPPLPARAPAPAAPAAPFGDAVARAGERLLQDAQASLGSGPRELVIDR